MRVPFLWILAVLAWAVFGSSSSWASAFELKLDERGLTIAQAEAGRKLLDQATLILPPAVKEAIGQSVLVSFDFSRKGEFEYPCDPAQGPVELGHVPGSWTGLQNEIVLHGGFLTKASEALSCGHGTYFRQALATLVHEVAHLYDHRFKKPLTAKEKKEIEFCFTYSSVNNKTCAYVLDPKSELRRVSSHRQFLEIAGWDSLTLKRKNQLPERAPDPYALKDPEEAFAVWMEYFLLDPELGCRNPAIYRYFAERFSHAPFRGPDGGLSCARNQVVYSASGHEPLSLDPSRVFQIHYLHAGEGEETSSRWGHSMLRLVVCDPKRASVGPDCLKDVSSHIVVSYRANVLDLTPGIWKGLTGKYPSNVFFSSLHEVIEEYTHNETRELKSVPLRLSARQKERLLEFLLEQYWTYDGRYRFFGNNCSTETAKAIGIAFGNPSVLGFGREEIVNPIKLLERLEERRLGDVSVFGDRDRAIEAGYLFPSEIQTRLRLAFESVRSILPNKYDSVEEYLRESEAEERLKIFKSAESRISKERRLAMGLLSLEIQLSRQNQVLAQRKAGEVFLDGDSDLLDQYQEAQKLQAPWKQLVPQAGYGVPLPSEISLSLDELSDQKLGALYQAAETIIRREAPELFSEKARIAENIAFLIRKFHSDSS